MAIACMAGLAVLFGAVLVVLEVTGTITWSGRVPGGAFEVTSTHVGVCFALVGMTVHIFMILKPSKYEKVTKTKAGYSADKRASGPRKRDGSAASEGQDSGDEALAKLLALSGLPENERTAKLKELKKLLSQSGSGHYWVETESRTKASSSPITGGR